MKNIQEIEAEIQSAEARLAEARRLLEEAKQPQLEYQQACEYLRNLF
jgi:hypothetical protein